VPARVPEPAEAAAVAAAAVPEQREEQVAAVEAAVSFSHKPSRST
jgi:hypothetical protein